MQSVTTYSQVVARTVGCLRQQQGTLDQKSFAEFLGVSASTWSRIENGQVGLALDQLAHAATLLGFASASELLAVADRAADNMRRQGVRVLTGREAAKDDQTFAYLGAAALGALLAAALVKR